MSESSPRPRGEQPRRRWTTADVLSVLRIPLAAAFPFVSNQWRLVLLAAAAASDLLDGHVIRRQSCDGHRKSFLSSFLASFLSSFFASFVPSFLLGFLIDTAFADVVNLQHGLNLLPA